MSPQFVDFDGDGRLDIVAATFDGSPKVARGTAEGFLQPVHILDRDGARIVMNQFWNFDTKKWDETKRCDPEGAQPGHLTSAWACDFDLDGDLDLLLGDHDRGQVMVRLNEGTTAEPAFAARNTLVRAGDAPLIVPGTVTTLRLVDGNGDGRDDLLVGSMGDAYGDRPGGAVVLYPDVGDGKVRRFGAPITWVPPSSKGGDAPTRPDSGLYMDVLDHDGDGDLDLVVGGYSHWSPPQQELTAAQRQRAAELKTAIDECKRRTTAILEDIEAVVARTAEAERDARRAELMAARRGDLRALQTERQKLGDELEPLVPGPKRRSFVWLYERLPSG